MTRILLGAGIASVALLGAGVAITWRGLRRTL